MGIRDLDTIDMILERPAFEVPDCKLVMVIMDATSDVPDDERYKMLLRKLTSYLAWVAGPGFAEEHPALTAADVIVRVITVTPPTAQMLQVDAVKTKDGAAWLRVFFDDFDSYMAKVRSINPRRPSLN
jgi:hypothetical protein